MKKILTIVAFAFFGAATVQAQEVNFGLKGGLNFADLVGDNSSANSQLTAFHVGAMAEIPLTEKFSFQPEVLFSGQGTSINDNILEMRYLNVPLIGKYYLTKGFSLEAGPQVGFLLSAKNEGLNVKQNFKNVDFGLNVGLGYKLENGLNFGARYNFGLSDINDVKGVSNKTRSSVLQASVGYFFF